METIDETKSVWSVLENQYKAKAHKTIEARPERAQVEDSLNIFLHVLLVSRFKQKTYTVNRLMDVESFLASASLP